MALSLTIGRPAYDRVRCPATTAGIPGAGHGVSGPRTRACEIATRTRLSRSRTRSERALLQSGEPERTGRVLDEVLEGDRMRLSFVHAAGVLGVLLSLAAGRADARPIDCMGDTACGIRLDCDHPGIGGWKPL